MHHLRPDHHVSHLSQGCGVLGRIDEGREVLRTTNAHTRSSNGQSSHRKLPIGTIMVLGGFVNNLIECREDAVDPQACQFPYRDFVFSPLVSRGRKEGQSERTNQQIGSQQQPSDPYRLDRSQTQRFLARTVASVSHIANSSGQFAPLRFLSSPPFPLPS